MTTRVLPDRDPSKPATAGSFAPLVDAGGLLRRATGGAPSSGGAVRAGHRGSIALVALWLLFVVAVRVITTGMWFDSVHHGSVYRTMIEAQILLFCVFGGRRRARRRADDRGAVRRMRSPLGRLSRTTTRSAGCSAGTNRGSAPDLVLLAVVIPAILVGQRAASGWQTYLLWRHATPWHATDPLFHKDISFFVEVYPFHVLVVALLSQAVTYGLWIAVIGGYWYGAWRLRRGRQKVTQG